MKHYILYNPLAGSGHSESDIEKVEKLLDGETVKLNVTEIADYAAFIEGLEAEADIVLCGGDGTLNKFINNIDGTELKNKLYYFAAGTGNDFLADIKGADKDSLLDIDQYVRDLPTVEVNGKTYRFINGVGYGIDGYCCEVGDAMRAQNKTNINYTMIAIKGLLFGYKPTNATVTVDGVTHEFKKVWIAPTMNGRCYGGGMIPTPEQDRLDPNHRVSLMVFHGTGKLKTLMIFPSIFKGEHVKHTEAIDVFKGHEITVKFDEPRALQIDGETVLGVTEYTVRSGVGSKVSV